MTDETPLPRLTRLQREIAFAARMWNATALRASTADAAAESTPGGDADTLERIAAGYAKAAKGIDTALMVVTDVRRQRLPAVWAGDTRVAASTALAAAERGLERGIHAMNAIAAGLRDLAAAVEAAGERDVAGRAIVRQASALTKEIAAGFVPDPFSYDGETMSRAQRLAMAGIADRTAAHTLVSEASRDVGSGFHDLAAQARLTRLARSPLSPVDELVLTDAGSTGDSMDGAILTAAMTDRAGEALGRLSTRDQIRLDALLAVDTSPERRAYVIRSLAAGYDIDRINAFNNLIGPYGDDPAWLREHLTPIDTTGADPAFQKTMTTSVGAQWTQGMHPTCVASSTVTARAQVDPLYALELTTGGHPGDPRYDNGNAFAERLRDEQVRVYDGGRAWYEKLPLLPGGMTANESATIASEEIGTRTGVHYHNRSMDGAAGRREVLPEIERAVDEGRAVPFTTREGFSGHQMLVVGHDGDMLQIYNPWGYTVWVSEDDFVNGHLDKIDPNVPRSPTSVRLPQV